MAMTGYVNAGRWVAVLGGVYQVLWLDRVETLGKDIEGEWDYWELEMLYQTLYTPDARVDNKERMVSTWGWYATLDMEKALLTRTMTFIRPAQLDMFQEPHYIAQWHEESQKWVGATPCGEYGYQDLDWSKLEKDREIPELDKSKTYYAWEI